MRIEDIVIDWLNEKIIGVWNGGVWYGRDYNRIKTILEHHEDKVLVRNIMESIEDETLKSKVKSWMESTEVLVGT